MSYDQLGINFDGSTDWLGQIYTVPAASLLSFVVTVKVPATPPATQYFYINSKSSTSSQVTQFWVGVSDTGTFRAYARGFADMACPLAMGQWVQIAGGLGGTSGSDNYCVMNGVTQTLTIDDDYGSSFPWTFNGHGIAKANNPNLNVYYQGDLGDVIIFDEYIDFREPANLAKIWEPTAGGVLGNGCPVDPGADGSAITGSEPLYCFRNDPADPSNPAQWNNKTTLGAFTVNGTRDAASSSPSEGCLAGATLNFTMQASNARSPGAPGGTETYTITDADGTGNIQES